MPRMPRACSTDRCRRLTALWRLPQGSRPRGQAPEGTAGRIERSARSRAAIFLFPTERDPRCFLGIVFGVWGVLMAPKPIRTPRSLRAWQSQDLGGTRKDKKLPVPGLKVHSNPYAKGPQQRISDMEKEATNSVPTMFASMMKTKPMPLEKVARDSQSSVPGVDGGQVSVAAISFEVLTPICDAGGMEPASLETTSASPGNSGKVVGPPLVGGEKSSEQEPKELKEGLQEPNPEKGNVQSRTLTNEALAQQAESMVKHLTIHETITPASAQRGKEAKSANSDQGLFDTAESFFFPL
ncbi:hypothetical protein NDU88_005086 [Pleurodeles waltl]|uniref:Uncharacterized protein n=1 Tax=Pleurodeles waltl TaxID=8319 RepID=A0AAV7V6W2_PLEWA|nr:hypothetical protein NDU88_005086 [Pleurodeles waltl]